ncbi:MAG: hypothetical protein QM820_38955 [Minicystis sp.]
MRAAIKEHTTTMHIFAHDFREVNQQLRRGQFFFVEIWQQEAGSQCNRGAKSSKNDRSRRDDVTLDPRSSSPHRNPARFQAPAPALLPCPHPIGRGRDNAARLGAAERLTRAAIAQTGAARSDEATDASDDARGESGETATSGSAAPRSLHTRARDAAPGS